MRDLLGYLLLGAQPRGRERGAAEDVRARGVGQGAPRSSLPLHMILTDPSVYIFDCRIGLAELLLERDATQRSLGGLEYRMRGLHSRGFPF